MKKLTAYNKKRHFRKTPEPTGVVRSIRPGKKLQFVIQRHNASHLHYDFRLELNGVLKSWAIPKGPSMDPAEKRLAVMVEDHPLAYGKFEGVIPKGNYGAGTVEIWDQGLYEPENVLDEDPQKEIERGLKKGSLKFVLHGKKVKGSFALVRFNDGKDRNWLLIKHRDHFADNKKSSVEESGKGSEPKTTPVMRSVRGSGKEKLDHYIKPMLATLGSTAFDDPEWIFEIKWDGYRAIAEVSGGNVKFYSRNGLSFAGLYPVIVNELKKIKERVILDGEVVVMDPNNKPSFQRLQQYGDHPEWTLQYYVFDCLSYQGKDITGRPLMERKEIMKKVLPSSTILKFSDHVEKNGIKFFTTIKTMDLEGMVAKRADSIYTPGKRSPTWLKIKNHNTQEAIIVGYTAPKGARNYFGALLLGIRSEGKLRYIGHAGTGYTEKILKDVYTRLQPLIRPTSPFDEKVPVHSPVTWVEPRLVCELKFSELTKDGILRHPVFMGLRIDKTSEEVDQIDVPATSPKQKKTVAATTRSKPKKSTAEAGTMVTVGGRPLKLTNLEKIYWPDEKITKGDLINYYQSIHKYILPYLKDRPESLKRNPNGIEDKGFFHKDAGEQAPEWVKSIAIHSESSNKDVDYIICNDQATLAYLNNLGCIELNPWNSTTKHLDKPDYLVMDIDPSEGNSFDEVIDTALVIKQILDKAKAKCYCKTSGATGLHIYIPLHAAYTYDQVKEFARLIATLANGELPKITTMERSLSKRKGRIYLDHLQNRIGQTLATAYSVRPVRGAGVSTPLEWKEVRHGLKPLDFNIFNLADRLKKKGDLFEGVLKEKIDLKKCLKALER